MTKIKTISILGPTASGKTGLAISLSKMLNGEVVDELWDVDIYRASGNATWVLTIQASCSLQRSLLPIISVAYLLEICGTHLWVLFAYCNAWYLIRHSNYIYVRDSLLLFSPDCGT